MVGTGTRGAVVDQLTADQAWAYEVHWCEIPPSDQVSGLQPAYLEHGGVKTVFLPAADGYEAVSCKQQIPSDTHQCHKKFIRVLIGTAATR